MSREFKTYLSLMGLLILFWLTGSFVDSALWFHASYRTPAWVIVNLDIIWLVLLQLVWPFLIVFLLRPRFNTVIAFFAAAFFGGVVWDLSYSLLTRGTWISDSLEHWFTLGQTGWTIGIPASGALLFHIIRLAAGGLLVVWLYIRTKKPAKL